MWLEGMLTGLSMLQGVQSPGIRDPNASVLLGQQRLGPVVIHQSGATVEVTGEREVEAMRAFVKWMTPSLRESAIKGWNSGDTAQMLAEFMAQDPSKPRPPTVGRGPYNGISFHGGALSEAPDLRGLRR